MEYIPAALHKLASPDIEEHDSRETYIGSGGASARIKRGLNMFTT
jgi:hypothetical protein